MLKQYIDLPELSEEPQIIEYADKSIALSWWPHQIYRLKSDELFDHEEFALGKGKKFHSDYVEAELKQKKFLE